MAAAATPCSRAIAGSSATARPIAGYANPWAASTARMPGLRRSLVGVAKPSILPAFACAA
jgi:hypothetical protein